MNELTHLDLFSGIGGFAIAARQNGYRTIGFCDNEPFAQAVLAKHWPEVPIHKDIREVRGELYAGVTLLTGGFPCQPFSVAGKQRGKDDNRYLWPEMLRVIREARPSWIIGENVAGIVNMALDTVCVDLEAEGYEVEPIIIPACAVDAPHRRDRVWVIGNLVGNSKLDGYVATKNCGGLLDKSKEQRGKNKEWESSRASNTSEDVAHTNGGQRGECKPEAKQIPLFSSSGERVDYVADSNHAGRRERCGRQSVSAQDTSSKCSSSWGSEATWLPEPSVGRVANGVSSRTHRLKGLGNAIVPQVAAEIIRNINLVMESK